MDWGRIGRGAAIAVGGVALTGAAVVVGLAAAPFIAVGGLSALGASVVLAGCGAASIYALGLMGEGLNDMNLGFHGFDDSVIAHNLVRDDLFGGDQQAFDQLGLYGMSMMTFGYYAMFDIPRVLSSLHVSRRNDLFRYLLPTINVNNVNPGMGTMAINPSLVSAQEHSFAYSIPVVVGVPAAYPFQLAWSFESMYMAATSSGGSGVGGGGSSDSYREFDIVPYNNRTYRTPGFEKHHGVLNEWAEHNIPCCASDKHCKQQTKTRQVMI